MESVNGRKMTRHQLDIHVRYIEHMHQQINIEIQRIIEQESVIEQLRQELCAIIRERKSLEKLKERERNTWLKEHRRREQSEMDEFASSGHFRQRQEAMVEEL